MTIEGNAPIREHLRVAERNSRCQVERLHRRVPQGTERVWEWFQELRRGLFSTHGNLIALTYAEIAAWAALTRTRVRPLEVARLRALDRVFLAVALRSKKNA